MSIPKITPAVDVWANAVLLPITIKLSVPPPCIVIALALPTVIFSLAESNNKFVDLISSASIVNPPMTPPLNSTFEPVICPLFFNIILSFELLMAVELTPKPPIVPATAFKTPPLVTLNGARPKVALPNCIPSSPSAIKISLPVPNVILFPLASKVKLVATKVLPLIVNPAIWPVVADILPLICASEAVICPLAPLSFSVPDVESKSAPMLKPPIVPDSAVILPVIWASEAVICPVAPFSFNVPALESKSVPILNPPIVPLWAVIFPWIWASDAVICPDDFNIKLSFVEFIWVDDRSKPPIVPPVNNTCEPVILPLDFNLRLLLLDLISELSKTNPPIVPVPVTSIFPSNKADEPVISPLSFTLKLELEINIKRGWSVPPIAGLPLIKILVLEKESLSVVKPPMIPLLADIVPSNCAPLAWRIPLTSTAKLGPNFT